MLEIAEIKFDDITIDDSYISGFDYERCKEGLWSIYNIIKKVRPASHPRVLECLCMIGANAEFENDDMLSLVYRGKTNEKYKRNMPSTQNLFELENYGFIIDNLITSKEFTNKHKLPVKDIERFRLSYYADDYRNVIFGLKLFTTVCMNKSKPNVCFYNADIRVAFSSTAKLYAPPINEVFAFLPEEQKNAAYAVHNKLIEIGCVRNCEGDATKYSLKKQMLATIWAGNHIWFLPKNEQNQKLVFKFNLSNIGKYAEYPDECTEAIRSSIFAVDNCAHNKKNERCENGQKNCNGVMFEYKGKKYKKCTRYFCIFKDLSEQAISNYVSLIELENEQRAKSGIADEM